MILFKGEEIHITETISLLYVKNTDVPVLRACIRSSCGCSGDYCESSTYEMSDNYIEEWRIDLRSVELVLTNVRIDDESIEFDLYID